VKVLFAFLHPVETKRSGMILKSVESIHPSSLMRKGNFSEADEDDLATVSDQARNEFARVGPDSAERVSRDENAHRTPGDEDWENPRAYLFFSVGREA
jgi:hypothetical protein